MSRVPGDLIIKDPSSIEPQGFDWTDYLAEFATTELIVTSTWTVSGPDAVLTTSSPSIVTGSLKTQVLLSAGTVGRKYTVTNQIVTTSSYTDDRSFVVLVQQR